MGVLAFVCFSKLGHFLTILCQITLKKYRTFPFKQTVFPGGFFRNPDQTFTQWSDNDFLAHTFSKIKKIQTLPGNFLFHMSPSGAFPCPKTRNPLIMGHRRCLLDFERTNLSRSLSNVGIVAFCSSWRQSVHVELQSTSRIIFVFTIFMSEWTSLLDFLTLVYQKSRTQTKEGLWR